jgi:hypothetical protein
LRLSSIGSSFALKGVGRNIAHSDISIFYLGSVSLLLSGFQDAGFGVELGGGGV